jgi:hypothetical protein
MQALRHPSELCLKRKSGLERGTAHHFENRQGWATRRNVIIRLLASNSPSPTFLGASLLKKALAAAFVLLMAAAVFSSCGSSNSNPGSGLKFRVFVSNPLQPTTTISTTPVLNIVDALNDLLSTSTISVSSASPVPGLMSLFPNKKSTLLFSAQNNAFKIVIVDNSKESLAQNSSGTTISFSLPGFTESMAVSPSNVTGFAAVPVPATGQPSTGIVEVLDLVHGTISASVSVPGARFLALSHNGNRLLVFGSRPDTVSVIATGALGTSQQVVTDVGCSQGALNPCPFDHPVGGVFSSDDNTAYILNCGQECGGTSASITALDLTANPLANNPVAIKWTVGVSGATIGLLQGSTLFVAGTPPGNPCGSGTLATNCGTVQTLDVNSLATTAPSGITDGYHNRMEMGANGQLFIGARSCTNLTAQNNNSGEIRGCLSIFSTTASSIVVPPQNGDVTGIQPIRTRTVVYVVQNAQLQIYDTATDKLQATQVDVRGEPVDVKLVD